MQSRLAESSETTEKRIAPMEGVVEIAQAVVNELMTMRTEVKRIKDEVEELESHFTLTMTLKQAQVFVQTAQLGVTCGLYHPIEWIANALDHCGWLPEEEIPEYKESVIDAFLAFFHGTGAYPEDPLETLDADGLAFMVAAYYQRQETT
jgi:hypothetical protein